MIAEISDRLLGEYKSEDTHNLFYGIGKWVYLIDALDDYDKDVKKKNYNPFLRAFGQPSRAQMLEKNGEEVDFIFKSVFAQNAECLKKIRFYFNHDLTDNIVLRGLPSATRRVLCGCGELFSPPRSQRSAARDVVLRYTGRIVKRLCQQLRRLFYLVLQDAADPIRL